MMFANLIVCQADDLRAGAEEAEGVVRRYKRKIEDLDSDRAEAVLDLCPVWYRSADRPDWSWYGLIVEEVAKIEPRLVHWAYPEAEHATLESANPETGETRTAHVLRPEAEPVSDGCSTTASRCC